MLVSPLFLAFNKLVIMMASFAHYLLTIIAGCLSVSNMMTGELVAKIVCPREDSNDDPTKMFRLTPKQMLRRAMKRRTAKALTNVTAVFFDEFESEIFTGTSDGAIHIWSCAY